MAFSFIKRKYLHFAVVNEFQGSQGRGYFGSLHRQRSHYWDILVLVLPFPRHSNRSPFSALLLTALLQIFMLQQCLEDR